MNYKIIAFTGKAQSGKTTSKQMLEEIINEDPEYKFQGVSFAQPLKELAFNLFNWQGDKELYYPMDTKGLSPKELNTPIKDKGRQLLINIGQQMRLIRPTVWADYAAKTIIEEIEEGKAEGKIYVIDDMRFKNELDVLEAFGEDFIPIKVLRKDSLDIDDISEKDLDEYDDYEFIIENNGSKEDLKRAMTVVLNEILLTKV